jgi:hypothetical protein
MIIWNELVGFKVALCIQTDGIVASRGARAMRTDPGWRLCSAREVKALAYERIDTEDRNIRLVDPCRLDASSQFSHRSLVLSEKTLNGTSYSTQTFLDLGQGGQGQINQP